MPYKLIYLAADERIVAALREPLEAAGLGIEHHGSRSALLEAVERRRPDALLLGLRLEDGTGLGAWRALRERGAPPPAMMLLPSTQAALRAEAFAAGFDDVVVSPIKVRAVAARLVEMAGGRPRAEPRHLVSLPAELFLVASGRTLGGVTFDVSREGLGLRTEQPLEPGAVASVTLLSEPPLTLFARVMHTREQPGQSPRFVAGTRLVALTQEEEAAVDKLVKGTPAVRAPSPPRPGEKPPAPPPRPAFPWGDPETPPPSPAVRTTTQLPPEAVLPAPLAAPVEPTPVSELPFLPPGMEGAPEETVGEATPPGPAGDEIVAGPAPTDSPSLEGFPAILPPPAVPAPEAAPPPPAEAESVPKPEPEAESIPKPEPEPLAAPATPTVEPPAIASESSPTAAPPQEVAAAAPESLEPPVASDAGVPQHGENAVESGDMAAGPPAGEPLAERAAAPAPEGEGASLPLAFPTAEAAPEEREPAVASPAAEPVVEPASASSEPQAAADETPGEPVREPPEPVAAAVEAPPVAVEPGIPDAAAAVEPLPPAPEPAVAPEPIASAEPAPGPAADVPPILAKEQPEPALPEPKRGEVPVTTDDSGAEAPALPVPLPPSLPFAAPSADATSAALAAGTQAPGPRAVAEELLPVAPPRMASSALPWEEPAAAPPPAAPLSWAGEIPSLPRVIEALDQAVRAPGAAPTEGLAREAAEFVTSLLPAERAAFQTGTETSDPAKPERIDGAR